MEVAAAVGGEVEDRPERQDGVDVAPVLAFVLRGVEQPNMTAFQRS